MLYGKNRQDQRVYRLPESSVHYRSCDHVIIDRLFIQATPCWQLDRLGCFGCRFGGDCVAVQENHQRDQYIGGDRMSAFEIGLVIGMATLVYITYELLKYEPTGK